MLSLGRYWSSPKATISVASNCRPSERALYGLCALIFTNDEL